MNKIRKWSEFFGKYKLKYSDKQKKMEKINYFMKKKCFKGLFFTMKEIFLVILHPKVVRCLWRRTIGMVNR